jgi:hypothetical protein
MDATNLASYRPTQEACAVRSLQGHRESRVQNGGNPCPSHAESAAPDESATARLISDISGLTGLAIIDAILAGERNPRVLAQLRHTRTKPSAEVIAKSRVGDYRRRLCGNRGSTSLDDRLRSAHSGSLIRPPESFSRRGFHKMRQLNMRVRE